MAVEHSRRVDVATYAAVAVWIAFAVRLMIADVWDETNGMLAFSSASMTLIQKLQFVLTQSLGFWRPIPTLVCALVLHFVRDFDVSWRILRAFNVAMLLGSLWFFRACIAGLASSDAEEKTGDSGSTRSALFTVAFLFSGSAVITAGWFANIFDAAALLLIATGLWLLLVRRQPIAAGVAIGIAFFCKETTALALPFLLMLLAARRITFRDALRSGIPAALLGALYFAIRAKIVPFGSQGDVHGFVAADLWPTVTNLCESFWRQTLKGHGWGIFGFVWTAISLAALRRPRLIGAALLFFCATALIYLGMFGIYQGDVLIHHLDFVGRLYLVPATLLLFMLAIERRTIAIAALCIPIVIGGYTTWRDHARFQRMYKRIYRTARAAQQKPLTVHLPAKPLDDTVRGVKIGDIPDAAVTIDPRTGRLSYR